MTKIRELLQRLIKPESRSLKIQSIRAAFWSFLGRGGSHFLRMVGSLILTRLLFPEAFGLMATATVFMNMLQLFSDTGTHTAIIQNPQGAEPKFLNSAWIINLCRGGILFLVMCAMAWPFARFYNQPELKEILFIMALSPLILGFENPAVALLIKNFRTEKQVTLEIGAQTLGLASSIVLAVILRSVYALAIGLVLSSSYRLLGSYVVVPYRPKLAWNKEMGLEIFHFGKFIFLNTMITWIAVNGDILLLGKLLDMDSVGFYNLGKNLGGLVAFFCTYIVLQSYLPAVSSVADDLSRVMRIYRRTVTFFLAVALPVSMVLAFFSQDLIRLLYDPRYQMAYISMFWLSLSGIFRTIGLVSGTTFVAMGKPIFETFSMGFGVVLIGILIPLGTRLAGLSGGARGVALALALVAVAESFYLIRGFKFSLKIVFRPWLQAILVMSVISGVFLLLRPWLSSERLYSMPFLVLMGILGIAVSGGAYLLLEGRHPFRDEGGSEVSEVSP
jgi:O-antigen/teichoic acid export membrane protein